MNDDLRVSLGLEDVSLGPELFSKLFVVVDFSIEYDPDGTIFVRNRLMAAIQIDDRKSSKTKPYRARHVIPFVVRATMVNGIRHPLEEVRWNALRTVKG